MENNKIESKKIENDEKKTIRKKEIRIYIISALALTITIIACVIFLDPFDILKKDIIDTASFVDIIADKPVINYSDGQVLDLQDLNITWQECNNSENYIYKVILLDGQPNYGDNNEVARPGTILLAENLEGTNEKNINITKDKLQEGKWLKIAVAACKDNNKIWSSVYVYINLSGNVRNTQVEIKQNITTPVIDGVINTDEYGKKIHSVDYTKEEFIDIFDPDNSIKSDFYMTWDNENLYFAWVVYADGHWPVPDCNNDGKEGTPEDLQNMWQYSSVQFMLSTGAPDASKTVYQTSRWIGNYLEAGLSILADGTSGKYIWSTPESNKSFIIDNISFAGTRDDQRKTTKYEVKISWEKLGIKDISEDYKFGFSYAISDQKDFDTDPNMVEWQDSILSVKNMDAGAIITLKK